MVDLQKYIDNISYENNSIKKYKLKKDSFRKVTIVSKPQVEPIKLNREDIEKIKEKPIGESLFKFRKKLYKNFKNENLTLLNNNIKSSKVKIKYIAPEILLLRFATGKYNIKTNTIKIIKLFEKWSVNHELFHMASSYYNENLKIGYSGFQQFFFLKKESIGCGLNEGYTELLSNRYFKEKVSRVSYGYNVCKFFSEKLEKIVGRERMESFYLNADLNGLYNYLLNFDESENIESFIVSLDYLLRHVSIFNSKKYESYYALIECYLAKWYITKMKQEFENGNIDENLFNYNIANYIDSLCNDELYIKNYVQEKHNLTRKRKII